MKIDLLQNAKSTSPDPMHSLEQFIFHDLLCIFAPISADLNRLSGCHDVTQRFPSQEPLPADYTFRSATPAILCTEHTKMKFWVDIIGYVCAFGYAIVIPTLMLYLFYRQRAVLRSSRMITGAAACDGDLKVCLHEVKGSTTERISRQDRGALACQIVVAVYG